MTNIIPCQIDLTKIDNLTYLTSDELRNKLTTLINDDNFTVLSMGEPMENHLGTVLQVTNFEDIRDGLLSHPDFIEFIINKYGVDEAQINETVNNIFVRYVLAYTKKGE